MKYCIRKELLRKQSTWRNILLRIINKASGIRGINFAVASVMDSEGRAGRSCLNMQGYLLGLSHLLSSHQSYWVHYFIYFHIGEMKSRQLGRIRDFKVTLLAYRSRYLNPNLQSSKIYFLSAIPYFSDKFSLLVQLRLSGQHMKSVSNFEY